MISCFACQLQSSSVYCLLPLILYFYYLQIFLFKKFSQIYNFFSRSNILDEYFVILYCVVISYRANVPHTRTNHNTGKKSLLFTVCFLYLYEKKKRRKNSIQNLHNFCLLACLSFERASKSFVFILFCLRVGMEKKEKYIP